MAPVDESGHAEFANGIVFNRALPPENGISRVDE